MSPAFSQRQMADAREAPELSVVVPMFNESDHVERVLDAITEHVGAAT